VGYFSGHSLTYVKTEKQLNMMGIKIGNVNIVLSERYEMRDTMD